MTPIRPIFLTTLALLLPLAAPSFAEPPPGPGPRAMRPGPPPPGLGPHELAELDLSDDQLDAFDSLRDGFRAETEELHAGIGRSHRALDELWAGEPLDEEAIVAAATEVGRLRQELDLRAVRLRLAMLRVLTVEQRAELLARLRERPRRGGPPPPPGGHRPPPLGERPWADPPRE